MDSYREHPSDFDLPSSEPAEPQNDVAAAIGTDERRMHVRAYNYWVSLLDGRDFPSIEDLEPGAVTDFAPHSVLLDFTCGRDNPALPYIGLAIRDECELSDDVRAIADVPSRSLLSRLTDHYMQILANRSPVGFEAEFANPRGENLCYRGILMPFSSDGDTIDFIYGVINWKKVDEYSAEDFDPVPIEIEGPLELSDVIEPEQPLELSEAFELEQSYTLPEPIDAEPSFAVPELPQAEEPLELTDAIGAEEAPEELQIANPFQVPFATDTSEDEVDSPSPNLSWQAEAVEEEAADETAMELPADAGLADRLWAARETAETVKAGEGRTRAALYQALSLAYDFAVAAELNPEEYAELLADSGVKAQTRAPMTPIVKLIFGVDYDKARLTEFAAALSFARRQEIEAGGFLHLIETQAGGLKALVAAEREARRPEPKPDTKGEVARARLRLIPPISLAEVPAGDEFAVVVTRRGADGRHEPVAVVADEALVERAIRAAS